MKGENLKNLIFALTMIGPLAFSACKSASTSQLTPTLPVPAAGVSHLKKIDSCANAGSALAPSGKLKAGFNIRNQSIAMKDKAGRIVGISVDLADEIAYQIGMPLEKVDLESPGKLADEVKAGAVDLGFLGIVKERGKDMDFVGPYVELESFYMVQVGSRIKINSDVDAEGIKIAITEKTAFELYLSTNLKKAKLVKYSNFPEAFAAFESKKFDAIAGLKRTLEEYRLKKSGYRILQERFMTVGHGIAIPMGRNSIAIQCINDIIKEGKTTGFISDLIKKNNVSGSLEVAPL